MHTNGASSKPHIHPKQLSLVLYSFTRVNFPRVLRRNSTSARSNFFHTSVVHLPCSFRDHLARPLFTRSEVRSLLVTVGISTSHDLAIFTRHHFVIPFSQFCRAGPTTDSIQTVSFVEYRCSLSRTSSVGRSGTNN